MIKTDWKLINDVTAIEAIKKVIVCKELDSATKYRLGIITASFDYQMNQARIQAKSLLHKYAKHDEKGEIIGYPDHTKIEFETPDKAKGHEEEFKIMLDTRFKIAANKLKATSLDPAKLEIAELMALKDLIEDV